MTEKKKIGLFLIVGMTGLALVGGYAWAAATKTVLEATYEAVVTGPPERAWTDDEGVEHVRGLPFIMFTTGGDTEGTAEAEGNWNLDSDGCGDVTGCVTWWGDIGTFEGRYSGTVTNWMMNAHGVYHGVGESKGKKLMVDITFDFEWFNGNLQITILDPHGG